MNKLGSLCKLASIDNITPCIQFKDCLFDINEHRGLKVADIYIIRRDVYRKTGSTVTWPFTKKEIDTIAAVLGYILKREWMAAKYINFS